jgi:hypothetical protein
MSGKAVVNLWPVLHEVKALVDTGADLDELEAKVTVPVQGGVTARQRLSEARVIVGFWSADLLRDAERYGATWHALYEPAKWAAAGEVTFQDARRFALELLDRHARWPRPDEWRRKFDRASGHRMLGESEDQGSLLPPPSRHDRDLHTSTVEGAAAYERLHGRP